MYVNEKFHAENATLRMSIIAGAIWYGYRGTFERYNGGGNPDCSDETNGYLQQFKYN